MARRERVSDRTSGPPIRKRGDRHISAEAAAPSSRRADTRFLREVARRPYPKNKTIHEGDVLDNYHSAGRNPESRRKDASQVSSHGSNARASASQRNVFLHLTVDPRPAWSCRPIWSQSVTCGRHRQEPHTRPIGSDSSRCLEHSRCRTSFAENNAGVSASTWRECGDNENPRALVWTKSVEVMMHSCPSGRNDEA